MTDILKPKQRMFVEAYLSTWNATEAARQANYTHPDVQGPRLLGYVGIRATIDARLKEKAMGTDEVLARLAEQARVSIADFTTSKIVNLTNDKGEPTGETIQMVELDWEKVQARGHLIKSITNTRHGPRIELHDGQTALIQLGKAQRLFVERHEVTGADGGPVRYNADNYTESVSLLAETLGNILSGAGPKPASKVDPPQ
jgi:phage terminase small subunit